MRRCAIIVWALLIAAPALAQQAHGLAAAGNGTFWLGEAEAEPPLAPESNHSADCPLSRCTPARQANGGLALGLPAAPYCGFVPWEVSRPPVPKVECPPD